MAVTKEKMYLFVCQLAAHIVTASYLLCFTMTDWVHIFIVYFFTGCFGISIGFHRLLSHKSFEPPKWFRYFCILCGSYGLVGSSLAWVNTHRYHHARTDVVGDPHSPIVQNWWRVQWLSMFYSPSNLRRVPDQCRDKFQVFLHKHYFDFHCLFPLCLMLVTGPKAVVVYYWAPAVLLWNMGSLINTVCHSRFGYRNFNSKDQSCNNPVLGFLVFGEGWHNNHHASPRSSRFGVRWFEFDISHLIIKAVSCLKW